MLKSPYQISICLAFLCLITYKSSGQVSNSIVENTIEVRVDPRSAIANEVPAKEVFSELEFIALERTKKSSFTTIDQFEIAGDFMFLFEKNNSIINGSKNSAIFIFTKSGKFQAKISSFRSNYFAVNYHTQEIVFKDFNSKGKWLFYNFKGNLLRTQPVPFGFTTFSFLDNNLVAHYQNYFFNASSSDILVLKPEFRQYNLITTQDYKQVDSVYLKFDKTILGDPPELYAVGKNFYNSQKLYFIPEYQYQVYSLSSGGLNTDFSFVFPAANSLPSNFLLIDKSARADYNNNKYTIYAISDFYKVGQMIAFKLNYNNTPSQTFFYDINSGFTTAYTAIQPDITSLSLSLGKVVIGADQNYFYSFLHAKELARYKKDIVKKENTKALPFALKQYFSSENENPVIVRYKPN